MPQAMEDMNLDITIPPELDLLGCTTPGSLRAIPLKENFTRTVCHRGPESTPLTTAWEAVMKVLLGTRLKMKRRQPSQS